MKKIITPNLDGRRKILIYGDGGVGKTVLACSAHLVEKYKGIFLIAVEEGYASAVKIVKEKFPIYQIDNLYEMEEVVEWLRKREQAQRYFSQAKTENDKKKYKDILIKQEEQISPQPVKEPTIIKTIVVDSLTRFQRMAMGEVTNDSDSLKVVNLKKSQYDDWGKNKKLLRNLINLLFGLKSYNIICTALSKIEDVNGVQKLIPDVEGGFKNEIGGFFDIVGFMSKEYQPLKKQTNKVIYWDDLATIAKNRLIAIRQPEDTKLINPTMESIEQQIQTNK
ncbi:hypothetical protein [Oceanotoga phage vB_OteS-UFV02]